MFLYNSWREDEDGRERGGGRVLGKWESLQEFDSFIKIS